MCIPINIGLNLLSLFFYFILCVPLKNKKWEQCNFILIDDDFLDKFLSYLLDMELLLLFELEENISERLGWMWWIWERNLFSNKWSEWNETKNSDCVNGAALQHNILLVALNLSFPSYLVSLSVPFIFSVSHSVFLLILITHEISCILIEGHRVAGQYRGFFLYKKGWWLMLSIFLNSFFFLFDSVFSNAAWFC